MTTASYPITGSNIPHSMWSKLFRRHHQGVDTGLTLSLSSTSDNATVGVGRAFLLGFMLEVTADHVLTLPAVATPTTYQIGILYDPADEGDAAGPLTLIAGAKGTITVPSNGYFWPIYDVTRQPSQTLNLAATKSYKTARMSLLYASSGVSDPPSDSSPQGNMLLVREKGFRLWTGSAWVDVKDDSGDLSSGVTMGSVWSSGGISWSVLNGVVFLSAQATLKTGNTITTTANGSITDSVVATLPAGARPRGIRPWVGAGSITLGSNNVTYHVGVRVYNDGRIVLTSGPPSLSIPAGTDLFISATYRN